MHETRQIAEGIVVLDNCSCVILPPASMRSYIKAI